MIDVKVQKKPIDLDKYKEGKVRVGWWSAIKYDDGISVAQVARWNEYGTPYIPSRPFFRPVVHGKKTELVQELRHLYQDAINNNKDTLEAMAVFGEDVIGRIKVSIREVVEPENSPVTVYGGWMTRNGKSFYVEGKGFNKPLYRTGFMLNSVDYEVSEVKA